mmetsp:Transcript_34381/g.70223  ORF Transcript_34381/g.70223 Transcript_34381/m.70223 type:complete len:781 (-) Transcript_34381:122-2464(-)
MKLSKIAILVLIAVEHQRDSLAWLPYSPVRKGAISQHTFSNQKTPRALTGNADVGAKETYLVRATKIVNGENTEADSNESSTVTVKEETTRLPESRKPVEKAETKESKRNEEIFIQTKKSAKKEQKKYSTGEETTSKRLDKIAPQRKKTLAVGNTGKSKRIYGAVTLSALHDLYDLVVIGGGPAGVAGAVKAAQMGRRAIIIDRPKLDGGVLCSGLDLFFGGPTGLFSKALRDAAKNTNVEAMRAQGLDDDVIWKQITNTVVKLATRNAEGQMKLLNRLNIDYLQGEASLLDMEHPDAVHALEECAEKLEDEDSFIRSVLVKNAPVIIDGLARYEAVHENEEVVVSASNILVATGSKSLRLPGIPFDGHRVFDSETINGLSFFPHSVVISGAGIIAIEYANIFKALGCESVTLIIRSDLESSAKKLGMDEDVSNELIRLLLASGVVIKEGVTTKEFEHVPSEGENGKVAIRLSDDSLIESDIFLAAVGRVPRGLEEKTGLQEGGVEVNERGMVKLSNRNKLRTTSDQVSAAGDVIGPPALASTSMEQAQRAVTAMFQEEEIDGESTYDPDEILSIGVWTIPEMGYYGLTKDAAIKQGHNVVEGIARFDECLRGRCFAPEGLLKLVVDSDCGQVLGVHLIGKEAAEMVHYGMALVKAETSIFEILSTTFTAVTFHELFKEAAFDANSKLDFGVEWQEIFKQLTSAYDVDELTPKELRERFDEIDEDGSGELDENELRLLFKNMGRPVSKRTIANLMRLSDLDGSGTIDWEEFKAIFDKLVC